MKILVTGGAGFIGSHIVDAYIADGHDVAVVDNLSTGCKRNVNSRARFYERDICDRGLLAIVEHERPDVINHQAAQVNLRASLDDPLADMNVNVGGLVNVLESTKGCAVKRMIFASSGGAIYGEQDCFPADETHRTAPLNPYGLNKLAGEQYLHYYCRRHGISWTALRYANVYGPRQNAFGEGGVVAIFTTKMLEGKQPVINGDGAQTRDYVFVGDVVESNRAALALDGNDGAYNVATGHETDVNRIFHILRELTGFAGRRQCGDAKAGEQRRSCLLSDKLTGVSGWRPRTTLWKGLSDTVAWYRECRT